MIHEILEDIEAGDIVEIEAAELEVREALMPAPLPPPIFSCCPFFRDR